MKDELGGNIMTKFAGLRAKPYSYLIDNSSEDKKAKGTKKCVEKNFLLTIQIYELCKLICSEVNKLDNI